MLACFSLFYIADCKSVLFSSTIRYISGTEHLNYFHLIIMNALFIYSHLEEFAILLNTFITYHFNIPN